MRSMRLWSKEAKDNYLTCSTPHIVTARPLQSSLLLLIIITTRSCWSIQNIWNSLGHRRNGRRWIYWSRLRVTIWILYCRLFSSLFCSFLLLTVFESFLFSFPPFQWTWWVSSDGIIGFLNLAFMFVGSFLENHLFRNYIELEIVAKSLGLVL